VDEHLADLVGRIEAFSLLSVGAVSSGSSQESGR